MEARLRRGVTAGLERQGQKLAAQSQLLGTLGYRQVLARGFALVRDADGRPLHRAADVAEGARLDIEFADGHRSATADADAAKAAPAKAPRPRPKPTQRLAVLSLLALFADIHGNREALDACLADAEAWGATRLVFLGDLVGYGADPAYIVDFAARKQTEGAIIVQGNHDAAVVGVAGGSMNETARAAIDWTRAQLDKDQRAFLAALPLTAVRDDVLFVHADAAAPARWIYIASSFEAHRSMRATPKRPHALRPCPPPATLPFEPVRAAERANAQPRTFRSRSKDPANGLPFLARSASRAMATRPPLMRSTTRRPGG